MKKVFFIICLIATSICSFAQITGDSTIVPNLASVDSIVYNYTGVCQNESYGEITINTYPQSTPYFYDWVGQGMISNWPLDSLDAGTYTFDIYSDLDLTQWLYRINIEIEEPQQITTFTSLTHPSCFNYENGEISIANTLGDGPFAYLWEGSLGNNLSNATVLSNVPSGTYFLTTYDTYGCQGNDTLTLENPLEIVSITTTDIVSCIDSCNGTSSVSVLSGGIGTFSYQWNDPNLQDTQTATNLCFGNYDVVVTDINGCMDTASTNIQHPDTLQIQSLTLEPACYNLCDGDIQVSITGGAEPYSYEWENTNGVLPNTTSTINNLCPDTYLLTFTDANSCIGSELIQLNEQDSFIINSLVTPISCYDYCDGKIAIHFTNQTNIPVSYYWSNGSQDTLAENLCSDSVSLVITDAENCIDTFTYHLNNPDSLYIQTGNIVDSLNCYGDSYGEVSISVLGGNAPYEYLWTTNGDTIDSTPSISSLTANQYDLVVSDNNSCVFDTIFTIYEPTEMENTFSIDPPSCHSYYDGTVEALITGGVENYIYQWNTHINDTLEILDSIATDWYFLTVVDSNDCLLIDSVFVDEPNNIILETTTTNVQCFGENSGTFSVIASGGIPPYNYNYFGQNPLQIQADTTYQFVLSDINGCSSDTILYSVSQPSPIINTFTISDASCFGYSDGIVNISTNGGIPSYQHDWNGEDPNNLFAGTYIVNTTDANNCIKFDTITINEPDEIVITPFLTEPSCYGYSDGTINALATGGNGGPYTYFPTLNSLTNIVTGTYTIIAEDVNNCSSSLSIVLGEPNELSASISSFNNISCYEGNDGEINILTNGGSLPHSFIWTSGNGFSSNSQNINNLEVGTYYLSITDANNCSTGIQQELNQPSALQSSHSVTSSFNGYNISCYNECDGEIETTNNGGTPPYSVAWSNGMSGNSIVDACAGTISYILIDDNNCVFTSTDIQLTEPEQITADIFLIEDASCFENCDGSAEVNNLIGGVPPYEIDWISSGESANVASSLCAENNEVFILDENECTLSLNVLINSPDEIVPNFTISPNNGQAPLTTSIANYSSGADVFSWSISNMFNDSIINTDFQTIFDVFGEHEVTLIATNSSTNCFEELTQLIYVEGLIELPNVISPNGDNINDYLSFNSYGIEQFSINIFNRWGAKVYTLKDVNEKWNGNSIYGEPLPEGVYFYVLSAEGLEGSLIEQKGSITLYR